MRLQSTAGSVISHHVLQCASKRQCLAMGNSMAHVCCTAASAFNTDLVPQQFPYTTVQLHNAVSGMKQEPCIASCIIKLMYDTLPVIQQSLIHAMRRASITDSAGCGAWTTVCTSHCRCCDTNLLLMLPRPVYLHCALHL